MPDPRYILKTTPPRLARAAVVRQALARRWEDAQDCTAVLVSAPRGFGKTTLLSQWRRAWLERGAFVAWVTLDAQDSPPRFAEALVLALHAASGRGNQHALTAELGAVDPAPETEVLTALLGEIAALATPTVIVLDDADRLPTATLDQSLSYLLLNAPPNLRLVIGSRAGLPLPTTELRARGELALIDAEDLRLSLADTTEVLQRKFGDRISLDDCVRLHEMTEGWPIGLQMAASTIERAPQLGAAIAELSARQGDIERYFLESMLSQLPPHLAGFLVRCSILESMTPALCAALVDDPAASAHLEQLMRETPIVLAGEGQGWLRLHTLARDFLQGRFEELPVAERHRLHGRAAAWYAASGHLREAARHALEGGDEAAALAYAAQSLRETARQGRLAEAREWMHRLPASAFDRDVDLRMSAAWIEALGDSALDAFPMVDPIIADSRVGPHVRFEAALIGCAAALFCDRPGLIIDYVAPWNELPATATPLHVVAHANPIANFDLFRGATDQVRRRLEAIPRNDDSEGSMRLAAGYADVLIGLGHLWEGFPVRADGYLQPVLERAEREVGRRSAMAAMFAGVLAGAVLERDQPARARALLADRLDIIDRVATPDAILVAYRTLADLALLDNQEQRAFDVLGALRELGARRHIPRMTVVSLAEQARIHAIKGRRETAAALLAQLGAVVAEFERPELRPLQPYARMKEAIAGAYVAMAAHDDARAEAALHKAAGLAATISRGREIIMVKALQAVVMERQGQSGARAKLLEARELASLHGLERLIRDLHPAAAALLGEPAPSAPAAPAAAAAERAVVAVSGGLLTAKETEVLRLLASGLSNKLIARTMDISDETVKWHLKNLFSKLSAGSRRHAVDRARLLGLVTD